VKTIKPKPLKTSLPRRSTQGVSREGIVAYVPAFSLKKTGNENELGESMRTLPADSDLAIATRQRLGVTQDIFARLVGVSQRSVSGWESGRPINDVSLRRLKELRRLAIALEKVMKSEFIPTWLVAPNEGMGGISPVEVMGRGENDRLWRAVFLLGSGIPI
jgi:transcriptional regulator with XRE-family HTH domain